MHVNYICFREFCIPCWLLTWLHEPQGHKTHSAHRKIPSLKSRKIFQTPTRHALSSTSTDSKCTDRKPECYNVRCPSDFKADTVSCVTTASILTRISILLSLLNSMSVSFHYTDRLDCCISIEVISHTHTHTHTNSICLFVSSSHSVLYTCTHTLTHSAPVCSDPQSALSPVCACQIESPAQCVVHLLCRRIMCCIQ